MPLFRRSDGTLVPGLPALRRIMPYLMRGRNESAVYVDMRIDVTRARKWLRACNRASQTEPCTSLHLLLFVLSRVIVEFPELNRFVSGRRLYQRTTATASLVIRESLDPQSPMYAVKVPAANPGESLPDYGRRLATILRNARDHQRQTEQEVRFVMRLPDPLVRLAVWLRDCLDECNLLPAFLIRNDPLYTTIFIANLGSLGLPGATHHLYECGTCGLFAAIAAREKSTVSGSDGTWEVREILPIRWSVDERIADGFTIAAAFQRIQSCLEDPARLLGSPQDAAQGKIPATVPENSA